MEQAKRCLRNLVTIPIYLYRVALRPFLPPCCRFHPSCSEYALQAIQTLGIIKGGLYTVRRVFRCHPWCEGGYDPVPFSKEKF